MASTAPTRTPETEARLEELCVVMRALKWRRGESGAGYAAKWGISLDRVNHLAAEAWRMVKAEATDVDRITSTVSLVLEEQLLAAREDATNQEYLATDGKRVSEARRAVVDAANVWADIVGAKAAQKIDNTNRVSLEPATTPADARRVVREFFGEVAAGLDSPPAPDRPGGSDDGPPEGTPGG